MVAIQTRQVGLIADFITIINGIVDYAQLFGGNAPNYADQYNKIRPYIGGQYQDGGGLQIDAYTGPTSDPNTFGIGDSGGVVHFDRGSTGRVVSMDGGTQEGRVWYLGASGAICISGIATAYPDGTSFSWYGDTGVACGMNWHIADVQFGEDKNNNPYMPNCVWLDDNHSAESDNAPDGSAQINTYLNKYNGNPPSKNTLCNDPYLVRRSDSLADLGAKKKRLNVPGSLNVANQTANINRLLQLDYLRATAVNYTRTGRNTLTRQKVGEDRLFLSDMDLPSKSARSLCDSDTSYGPDYINFHENLYCDMKDKKVYNTCHDGCQTDCVYLNGTSMSLSYENANGTSTLFKSYGLFERFGSLAFKSKRDLGLWEKK